MKCVNRKSIKISFVIFYFTTALTFSCLAEGMPQNPQKVDSVQSVMGQDAINDSFDSFTLFLKMIGLIICISVVLYLILRWYKKSVYGTNFNKYSTEMKLLGAMNIGPKKSICMINVLDHVLVLGLTENDVSLLLDIPEANINERVRKKLLEDGQEQPRDFGKLLNQWMKKNTA